MHHSTDGGDTWSILYQADLLGVGGIIDIEQYDDIYALYTYTDGIYIYRIKWIILLLVTFLCKIS